MNMPAIEAATARQLYLAEPSMTTGTRAYTPVREHWIRRDADSGTTFRTTPNYERVREYSRTAQIVTILEEVVNFSDVITAEEQSGATAVGEAIETIDGDPSAFDKVVAQLIRFEAFDANWDGNGASKPNLESLRDARIFVRSLAPESIVPEATLHADGTAALLFMTDDTYVELEFLGSKTVGYFARRGSQEWNDDFSFAGGSLPDALFGIGFVLEKKLGIAAE